MSDNLLGIGLALDVAFVLIIRRSFLKINEDAEKIRDAPTIRKDEKQIDEIMKANKGYVPYACVKGIVEPEMQSLQSLHNPTMSGVIQVITKEEHKSKKVQGIWADSKSKLSETIQKVPCVLQKWLSNEPDTKLKIAESTEASFIMDNLTTTYDHFEPNKSSALSQGISRLFGEVPRGIHETEKMLLSKTAVLGIGELVKKGENFELRPPRSGAKYILTTMSKVEVIKKLEKQSFWLKIISICSGVVGTSIFLYIVYKFYQRWKTRRDIEQLAEEMRQHRERLRRKRLVGDGDSVETDSEASDRCTVCLENPRQVVLLNCGHICLCSECLDRMPRPLQCPVCRQAVARFLPVYNP